MQIIDLFSGIGGFSLGGHWIGWKTVQFCEIDPFCRKVLAKNFPGIPIHLDIKTLTRDTIIRNGIWQPNKPTIVVGGFPCQPFSVAGKQGGKDDDRYLWNEMLRVIATIKPTFVVGENVPGIVSMALDTVLSDLEREGYTTETFIIPACSKNAWHKRDRVWIIAYQNTDRFRCNGSKWEKESNIGKFGEFGTGNNERVHRETATPNLESIRREQSGNTWKRWAGFEDGNCNYRGVLSNPNNTGRKEQWEPITDESKLFAPKCGSWWEAEPGVDRVVNGLPRKLDKNLTKYEKRNYQKTFTEIDFIRWEVLRIVWSDRSFAKASPRLQFGRSENCVPEVPHIYSCAGKELGERIEKNKELCDLWERIYSKPFKETQNLQLELLIRIRQSERCEKMENRVDRIKALGNAIVPQIAYEIFKIINHITQ